MNHFEIDWELFSKYIWDRAPISIAMKGGNIRKDGDEYVIRYPIVKLWLSMHKTGFWHWMNLILGQFSSEQSRAHSWYLLMIMGKSPPGSNQWVFYYYYSQESLVKNASIIELNKEGGEVTRKREVEKGSSVNTPGKKSRARSLKNTEESQSPYFDDGFEVKFYSISGAN